MIRTKYGRLQLQLYQNTRGWSWKLVHRDTGHIYAKSGVAYPAKYAAVAAFRSMQKQLIGGVEIKRPRGRPRTSKQLELKL